MKVVLLTDVAGIGRQGEVKEVSDGYYRNFLIPKKLAALPGEAAAETVVRERAAKVQAETEEKARIAALARSFEGRTITLTAKAQGQKLFGAVTAAAIAEALGVAPKLVTCSPLKTLGEHRVVLQFPGRQQATVTVRIEPI